MKLFEKLTSKMAKTASVAVKEEVKSTALDILPTLIGIGGMILGGMVYRDHRMQQSAVSPVVRPRLPDCSRITITTNNYYFGYEFRKEKNKDGE